MPKRVIQLLFKANYGRFNAGEVGGFSPEDAKRMLDLTATVRISEIETARRPLVVAVGECMVEGRRILSEKKYDKPVAERLGVLKEASEEAVLEAETAPEPAAEDEEKPSWGKRKKHA